MITMFSGVPGSGKSYKMVAELSRNKDKFYVVHNIDGLKPEFLGEHGLNFIKYCEEKNLAVEEFLSKEYQIEFTKAVHEKFNRPCLVIIDEAHEWFSKQKNTLKMWLSYHRHLDQEIWLVAHRSTNIPSIYRSFIEVEYRAKSGAFLGIPGYFFYNRILGGQRSGFIKERKKQQIFDLYKSQMINTEKKRAKPVFLQMVLGVAVLGVIMFFFLPQYCMKKSSAATETKKVLSEGQVADLDQSQVVGKSKTVLPVGKSFAEKYAFVGVMNDRVVIEDRETGEQLSLEKIPSKPKLVEYSRNDHCTIYLMSDRSFHTLYNTTRYIEPEKSQRQQSGDFSGAFNPKL